VNQPQSNPTSIVAAATGGAITASVVIAAYNEGERLAKTVASCLGPVAELGGELIVADDASTDGSAAELLRRFPGVRVMTGARRRGVAATRAAGARIARGAVLIFLDGHCHPERGALHRLVAGVEASEGEAVLTPRVAVLDAQRWENRLQDRVGHGFRLDLETLERFWVDREAMRAVPGPGNQWLYECPAPPGCCLAVGRRLYRALGGFDRGMRVWGSEDLDFGLKAWLTGHPVLHDPGAVVGHWFRPDTAGTPAAAERVVANQLRLARKHFGDAVWHDWLRRCRARHRELSWSGVWGRFERDRAGLERERAALLAARVRDEFWYAERFDLWWPLWLAGREPDPHWGEHLPDRPRALFEAHARHPRNRGLPASPGLVGTAQSGGGSTLALALTVVRARSGEVRVARTAFDWSGPAGAAEVACASWVATRAEGEPVRDVRAIGPDAVRAALGLETAGSPCDPAEVAIVALRAALGRL